jgi:hypothetical protein
VINEKGGLGRLFFASSFYFEQDARAVTDCKALRVLTVCKAQSRCAFPIGIYPTPVCHDEAT